MRVESSAGTVVVADVVVAVGEEADAFVEVVVVY